jgi:hypothetical protein
MDWTGSVISTQLSKENTVAVLPSGCTDLAARGPDSLD